MSDDFDREITTMSPQRHRIAVTHLVNHQRVEHGLKPLLPSRPLVFSARVWAITQAKTDGRISHGRFARRALRFPFVLAGKPKHRRAVGENIGFGTGPFSTPRSIVDEWMQSPGHRANILRPWQYGAVWSSPGRDEGVTVVHHFGRNLK
jgi:uncharacterized protein YkwD